MGDCAAERIRTSDPRFRRPMLYPTELQPQSLFRCCRVLRGGAWTFVACWAPRFRPLRHAGTTPRCDRCRAEREGFEPSVGLLSPHSLSKRAPSASRSSPQLGPAGASPCRFPRGKTDGSTARGWPRVDFPGSAIRLSGPAGSERDRAERPGQASSSAAAWFVLRFVAGGGGGIRTPGAFQLYGFQDRRLQPLGHSSRFECGRDP